jgi:ABC-type dipeptide/oligopeptide/nickel transport system ATPase component
LSQVGIPDPQSRLASYPHQLSGGKAVRDAFGPRKTFG